MTAAALLGGLGHPAARPCRGGAPLSHVVTDNSLKSGLPLAREWVAGRGAGLDRDIPMRPFDTFLLSLGQH